MRLFALALTLSLTASAAVSAQTATPDSENGRYSFNPVSDGVLRLDTRTGQVSHCSRSDAGWACKVIPDERSALESEIARLQDESATLKKELLARGLPAPGAPTSSTTKPDEPEFKLPSDADVDKMISFLEKFWRRLITSDRRENARFCWGWSERGLDASRGPSTPTLSIFWLRTLPLLDWEHIGRPEPAESTRPPNRRM